MQSDNKYNNVCNAYRQCQYETSTHWSLYADEFKRTVLISDVLIAAITSSPDFPERAFWCKSSDYMHVCIKLLWLLNPDLNLIVAVLKKSATPPSPLRQLYKFEFLEWFFLSDRSWTNIDMNCLCLLQIIFSTYWQFCYMLTSYFDNYYMLRFIYLFKIFFLNFHLYLCVCMCVFYIHL